MSRLVCFTLSMLFVGGCADGAADKTCAVKGMCAEEDEEMAQLQVTGRKYSRDQGDATCPLAKGTGQEYSSEPPVKASVCGKNVMPPERQFGWHLKKTCTSLYKEVVKGGQIGVVVEHAIIRGVTPEMIQWYFQVLPWLDVQLKNVPGYGDEPVSIYLLWHPVDHICQVGRGKDKGKNLTEGNTQTIIESFKYGDYGWTNYVDSTVNFTIFNEKESMITLTLPKVGTAFVARFSYAAVPGGTSYHYEVAQGLKFGELADAAEVAVEEHLGLNSDYWAAWYIHDIEEIGTWENFLPVLYEQRHKAAPGVPLVYDAATDNLAKDFSTDQQAYNPQLFDERAKGMEAADDVLKFVLGGWL